MDIITTFRQVKLSENVGVMRMRFIPCLLAILIMAGSGVIHGIIVDRWAPATNLSELVTRIENIPMEIGSWQGVPQTIPDTHLEIGQIDGYLSRTYTNQGTGAAVSLLIVGGKPGPISVHTPDICFLGAGYELKNTPMQTSITPEDDPSLAVEAFSADFKKSTDAQPHDLRVLWTWCDGQAFHAPTNPRFTFADRLFLYKVYITQVTGRGDHVTERDDSDSFLKTIIPILQREFCLKQNSKN